MAEDLNSVTIVGRLTRDIELSYTNSGFAIGKLSIATNKRKKVNDSWEDVASFFDVTILGKRAESLQQYLSKGIQVAIAGSLEQSRWEDQQGNKRSKVSIIADNIQLLGGKKDNQQAIGYQQQAQPEKFMDDIPY